MGKEEVDGMEWVGLGWSGKRKLFLGRRFWEEKILFFFPRLFLFGSIIAFAKPHDLLSFIPLPLLLHCPSSRF